MRFEARIVTKRSRTIGAEDGFRRAHIEVDVRVVLGLGGTRALELLYADPNLWNPSVVLEFGMTITHHRVSPIRVR